MSRFAYLKPSANMGSTSPLGQYAPLVASITGVLVIGGYLLAIFAAAFGAKFDPTSLQQLHDFAFIAGGVIFGSALGVNGWKAPVTALHARQDAQDAQLASIATTVGAPVVVTTHAAEVVTPHA